MRRLALFVEPHLVGDPRRIQTYRMQPLQPIIISNELFQELDAELLTLLRSLGDRDWNRPTICSKWAVKDIAAHLLDGSIRRLSIQRDRYLPSESPRGFASYANLVAYLNDLNAIWTKAARRISPAILIQLLEITGMFGDNYSFSSCCLNWECYQREWDVG